MAVINNDLSIFTSKNENGIKLSDRLNTVLTNSKYFDVLVGYFRITGFYLPVSFSRRQKECLSLPMSILTKYIKNTSFQK